MVKGLGVILLFGARKAKGNGCKESVATSPKIGSVSPNA